MAENYIKGIPYHGHDITLQLRTNTGTFTDPTTNITENTHTIWTAIDLLTTITLTATSAGTSITDVTIADLFVSAISLNGAANSYAGDGVFEKLVADDTITYLDGTNIAISDTIAVLHLPDGTGTSYANIRQKDLTDMIPSMIIALKKEVDSVQNIEIYDLLTGLHFEKA